MARVINVPVHFPPDWAYPYPTRFSRYFGPRHLPSLYLRQKQQQQISLSRSLPRIGRRGIVVSAVKERAPVSDDRMLVFVPPHPLIKHWISVLRNEQTPCPIFKNAMAELGRLLIYEASRDWLPTVVGEIQSPMGLASVEFIDPREPVMIIPILRAGLALVEHAASILPATKTYHLGMSRNEETLQPSIYLNKLPDKFPEGSRILVVDPMLATGGTIVAAIDLLKDRGVENKQIKVISAVAAPTALQKLSEKFPGLHVYSGTIDPTVNEKGNRLSLHAIASTSKIVGRPPGNAEIELLTKTVQLVKQCLIPSILQRPSLANEQLYLHHQLLQRWFPATAKN